MTSTTCTKCGIKFHIKEANSELTQITTCSDPGCGRRFWHGNKWRKAKLGQSDIAVGVTPQDHEAWMERL
jgi:uncharacterized protein with PIN domain